MKKIFSWFSRNKLSIVLFSIIAIGIFLRIYNFSDWVRFNDDQVRDALVIDRMISGEEFPLLGPKAGGTNFNLGPAFYYFEYFSALVFGNTPDVLAYPVLFFSILSIPLFYFVFRKIFNQNISLALTLIYSVSFFSVKYSRFAWNINLVPFFVLAFIYLLAKIFDENEGKKYLWSVILGLIIGIGAQLHTLLLFCFPAVFVAFCILELIKNKKIDFKRIIFVVLVAMIVNLPLVAYDINSNGENLKAFIKGANSKTESKVSIGEKFSKNISCQIQGNSFVLSAYGNNDGCDILQKDKEAIGWIHNLNILLSIVFFTGGIALVLFFSLKKKYFSDNNIFRVLVLYFLASFILFIPLSGEIALRMFVVIIFVPFLFLGLWLGTIKDRMRKIGIPLSMVFILTLSVANIFVFKNTYFALGDMYRDDELYGGANLGELESIADYIENSRDHSKKTEVSKFENSRSLEYLLEKRKINVEIESEDEIEKNISEYFLIKKNDFRINNKKKTALQKEIEKFEEKDSEIIGQYTVFKLVKEN